MNKVLMIAPMCSVHRRFNKANINVLKRLGYEIHLLANFDLETGGGELNRAFVKQCSEEGIKIYNLPFKRAVHVSNVRLIRKIRNLIYNGGYDIVHAHTETGGLLLRLAMIGKTKRFKAVYTPHGMSFYKGSPFISQRLFRPIERWICNRMDCNLAINTEEMEFLKLWNSKTAYFIHGIGIDTAGFVNTGTDSSIRNEMNIPQNAILLTAIGELNENKNHKVIIEAMHRLKNDDLYLVVCGVGPEKNNLLKMTEEFGLNDRIKLVGYRNDIKNILDETDIFVFSSFHEGLPVSIMEAMTEGLPVVCSDIRGNRDLIISGRGGYLFNPNSYEDLSEKIDMLIKNPKIKDEMGIFNLEKVKSYDIGNVENELVKIYRI
ncbi:MAG: glycosyltransferase [Clostridia bacterium]|nr:glycosyltransferase [Clostridia bacterium]